MQFLYLFIYLSKREYKECRQKSFTSTEFLRSHFYATSIFESFLVIRTNQIFKNILFEYTHKKKITRKKYYKEKYYSVRNDLYNDKTLRYYLDI